MIESSIDVLVTKARELADRLETGSVAAQFHSPNHLRILADEVERLRAKVKELEVRSRAHLQYGNDCNAAYNNAGKRLAYLEVENTRLQGDLDEARAKVKELRASYE